MGSPANDKTSKFDRLTAYSFLNIKYKEDVKIKETLEVYCKYLYHLLATHLMN